MFDTPEDASQKLASTVILFKEEPIYILSVGGSPKKIVLNYWDLPMKPDSKADQRAITIGEPGLDYRTLGMRLGYMNAEHEKGHQQALYVSRMAVRKSIQGLSKQNTFIPDFSKNEIAGLMPVKCLFDNCYAKPFFRDMLKGIYPDLKKVKDRMENDEKLMSMSFNRLFAVTRKNVGPFFLEYKGKDIAWSANLHKFMLAPTYKHLAETLEHHKIDYKLSAS